jgi:ribose transport system permease protein
VALGGTSLAGGRGGILGSLLGAACIYLLQQLLSSAGVAANYLQLVYGVLLVAGVVISSASRGRLRGAAA